MAKHRTHSVEFKRQVSQEYRRLMREHDLQPKMRRGFTKTTDGDHDQPIFPNLAKTVALDGPDQLWVADITYVTIVGGFVYVAVILDAWSRPVVAMPSAAPSMRDWRSLPCPPRSKAA